jgi:assimilatory nitrate reductase catalytic subunit
VIEAAFRTAPVLAERHAMLNGQSVGRTGIRDALSAAAFSVGKMRYGRRLPRGAIPAALGAKLRCGTNCGSCVPELKGLFEV